MMFSTSKNLTKIPVVPSVIIHLHSQGMSVTHSFTLMPCELHSPFTLTVYTHSGECKSFLHSCTMSVRIYTIECVSH